VIANLISRRSVENFLHDIPGWAGWQRLLLENTWCHDSGANASATPTAHFGIPEKRAQRRRIPSDAHASVVMLVYFLREQGIDVGDADHME